MACFFLNGTQVSVALLYFVVIAAVIVVIDDDQLCLEGAVILLAPPTVILTGLEAHEDGCDWLCGVYGAQDSVRGVSLKQGGGGSVRLGRAII